MGDSYNWIKVVHIIGWVMWIGSLIGLSVMLSAHRSLAESTVDELIKIERKIGIEMDIGATIAILCGILLIMEGKVLGSGWVMKKAWMHTKLTMVLGLFAAHVYIRVKVIKAKNGDRSGISPIATGVVVLLFIGIIVMAVARPIGKA